MKSMKLLCQLSNDELIREFFILGEHFQVVE